jgi:hypothetical protein
MRQYINTVGFVVNDNGFQHNWKLGVDKNRLLEQCRFLGRKITGEEEIQMQSERFFNESGGFA